MSLFFWERRVVACLLFLDSIGLSGVTPCTAHAYPFTGRFILFRASPFVIFICAGKYIVSVPDRTLSATDSCGGQNFLPRRRSARSAILSPLPLNCPSGGIKGYARTTLCSALKGILEERYLSELNNRTKDVLLEVVKHEEITNKSIAEKLDIARSNVSHYMSSLESQGCVYVRRRNGKDKFWSAQPQMKWYVLKVDEERAKRYAELAKQKLLKEF